MDGARDGAGWCELRPRRSLLVLPLLAAALFAQAGRGQKALTILHTNDLHGNVSPAPGGIAGFAAVAAYLNQVRQERKNVLVLDAGDCISGTPLSSLTKGRAIFDLMNLLRYDAGTIGNHEFDHGWRLIPEFVERAKHPIVCANAFDPDGKPLGDAPWVLREVDGVKVGILGLVTEDTPRLTVAKGNEGVRFEKAVEAARRLVPEVDRAADLVILLTHVGHQEEKALARAVPGVDLIIGGHSHTEVPEPVRVGDTWVAQAWEYTKRVGRIEVRIDLDRGRVVEVMGSLVAPAELKLAPDPEVAKAVAEQEAAIAKGLDERLAEAKHDLEKKDLYRLVEQALRETVGGDFGFHNSGGIRGELKAGPITLRDLWRILPFENSVVKLSLKGGVIGGAFGDARKRQGSKLDGEKLYTIVTNSFVADHTDRYFGTAGLPVEDTGRPIRDVVADWLKRQKVVP